MGDAAIASALTPWLTKRTSGLREIRRQPLCRALLDESRNRVSDTTQTEHAIRDRYRHKIGSMPPTMGRPFGSSSSTITNANCMRCTMEPASRRWPIVGPRKLLAVIWGRLSAIGNRSSLAGMKAARVICQNGGRAYGRHYLSLQERHGGAKSLERDRGSLCDLQGGAALREDEDCLLQGCEPARRLSECPP